MATRAYKKTFKERLYDKWISLLNFVKGITILVSLFLCPITLAFLIYHTFFCFDSIKAVVACLILVVMPYLNIKIQGVK